MAARRPSVVTINSRSGRTSFNCSHLQRPPPSPFTPSLAVSTACLFSDTSLPLIEGIQRGRIEVMSAFNRYAECSSDLIFEPSPKEQAWIWIGPTSANNSNGDR